MTTDFPLSRTTNPTPVAERGTILADPGFGRWFTDHMATAKWTPAGGWHDHRIGPLEPFSMHPSTAVLHYAQEIFEGLKAYRHADGSVWLFRPDANARRFARSAARLALPQLPEEDFLTSVAELVRADEAWVPTPTVDESLYLRPFMFASEAFLGVRPAAQVTYAVIASPAAPSSLRASPASRCGSAASTPVRPRAVPERPSAAATTPRAWPRRSRRSSTAATR